MLSWWRCDMTILAGLQVDPPQVSHEVRDQFCFGELGGFVVVAFLNRCKYFDGSIQKSDRRFLVGIGSGFTDHPRPLLESISVYQHVSTMSCNGVSFRDDDHSFLFFQECERLFPLPFLHQFLECCRQLFHKNSPTFHFEN